MLQKLITKSQMLQKELIRWEILQKKLIRSKMLQNILRKYGQFFFENIAKIPN